MKVLNLRCEHGHAFEGWFASEDDFLAQNQRQLIECPMCGSVVVQKMPSAPRLNFGAKGELLPPDLLPNKGQERGTPSDKAMPGGTPAGEDVQMAESARMQAALLKMARHVMENTEDVGRRFAQEARKMHHGEMESRPIRGEASLAEAKALIDEGVDVLPLPRLPTSQGPLH